MVKDHGGLGSLNLLTSQRYGLLNFLSLRIFLSDHFLMESGLIKMLNFFGKQYPSIQVLVWLFLGSTFIILNQFLIEIFLLVEETLMLVYTFIQLSFIQGEGGS